MRRRKTTSSDKNMRQISYRVAEPFAQEVDDYVKALNSARISAKEITSNDVYRRWAQEGADRDLPKKQQEKAS